MSLLYKAFHTMDLKKLKGMTFQLLVLSDVALAARHKADCQICLYSDEQPKEDLQELECFQQIFIFSVKTLLKVFNNLHNLLRLIWNTKYSIQETGHCLLLRNVSMKMAKLKEFHCFILGNTEKCAR